MLTQVYIIIFQTNLMPLQPSLQLPPVALREEFLPKCQPRRIRLGMLTTPAD